MAYITPPPAFRGDEQAQLTQVYRYLFRLSEQLNATSDALDRQANNASEAIAKAAGIDPAAAGKTDSQFTPLVSLVIKTAEIVSGQMDKIVTTLGSKYIAQSEWGTYMEEVNREIEESARNTMESFIYDAKLESLTDDEVKNFSTHLEGFIVRGIIGFDEEDGVTPIVGIAIGRELFKKKVKVGGQTYEVIDTDASVATYTADKLSFWINGVEVAYLSNSVLQITKAKISDSIELGDWLIEVNDKDGMTVQQKIGEALSGHITITAAQINAIADEIDFTANEKIQLVVGKTNYMEVADEGIFIKDRQEASILKLNSGSVNIGTVAGAGQGYSQFTASYAQFGNYQMRKTADGGIAFKLSAKKEA